MNLDWKILFKFPFNDKRWVRKLLVGSALSIIPIINVITLGYFLACIRHGVLFRQHLPDWKLLDIYLQEGLWALLIIVIYLLVPFLGIFILGGIPFIGGFFTSLLLLGMGLLIPMALAHFAVCKRVEDAFRIGEIIRLIVNGQPMYTIVYLTAVFLFSLLLILTVLIPILILISGLLFFYAGVVISFSFGYIYARC